MTSFQLKVIQCLAGAAMVVMLSGCQTREQAKQEMASAAVKGQRRHAAEVFTARAKAALRQKNKDKAADHLVRALQLDPTFAEAQIMLKQAITMDAAQ